MTLDGSPGLPDPKDRYDDRDRDYLADVRADRLSDHAGHTVWPSEVAAVERARQTARGEK